MMGLSAGNIYGVGFSVNLTVLCFVLLSFICLTETKKVNKKGNLPRVLISTFRTRVSPAKVCRCKYGVNSNSCHLFKSTKV